MPALTHLPQYERHLTLSSLYHCPRDYWYTAQMRAGTLAEDPASESLLVGILVHVGLAALWRRERPWQVSLALDAIDRAPEAVGEQAEQAVKEAKKAVTEYAAQWTGARDHWWPLYVEDATNETEPEPWRVLGERFLSYPDLIVTTKLGRPETAHVVDYKTSKWKFDAKKWEYHPELLTQCIAAKQALGGPVTYQVDFLQRPSKYSTVWGMPTTPVWKFTKEKEQLAWTWVREGLERIDQYEREHSTAPWPQALTCETPWGLCRHYGRCFDEAK